MAKEKKEAQVKERVYSKLDSIYDDQLAGIGSGLANLGNVGMRRERFVSQDEFDKAQAQQKIKKDYTYRNIDNELLNILRGGLNLDASGKLSQGRVPVDNPSFLLAVQRYGHENASLTRSEAFTESMNAVFEMNERLPEGKKMSQRELMEVFAPQALTAANEVYKQASTNINNMLDKGLDHIRQVQPPEYFEEKPEETQLAFAAASQFATAIGSITATATGSPGVGSAISQGGATAFESMGKDMNEQAKANRLLNQKLYNSYSSSVAKTNEAITDLTKKALEELSKTDRKHIENTLSAWEKRQERFVEIEKQKLEEYKANLDMRGEKVDQNYKSALIAIKNKEAQIKSLKAQSDLTGKLIEREAGEYPRDMISKRTAIDYNVNGLDVKRFPDLINSIENPEEQRLVANAVAEFQKGFQSIQNKKNGAIVVNAMDELLSEGFIPGATFNKDTVVALANSNKNKQEMKEVFKDDFVRSVNTDPFTKAIVESSKQLQATIPTGEIIQTEVEVGEVKREVAKIMSAIESRDTNRLTKLLDSLEGQESFLKRIISQFTGKSFTDKQIKLLKEDGSRVSKKILSAAGE